ncbi:transducin/WD40 repeat-like superfamily protein [Striga asiatica]|uniref:Transducin/WD40 repeat-like superfamily protein n=1 Tax=Striga asiatica TaxID=4170 RepID=A0A5A7PUW5_STRAF|nr:transducin/WD40 repeat-like superfamily protein [Striga asiatica]
MVRRQGFPRENIVVCQQKPLKLFWRLTKQLIRVKTNLTGSLTRISLILLVVMGSVLIASEPLKKPVKLCLRTLRTSMNYWIASPHTETYLSLRDKAKHSTPSN